MSSPLLSRVSPCDFSTSSDGSWAHSAIVDVSHCVDSAGVLAFRYFDASPDGHDLGSALARAALGSVGVPGGSARVDPIADAGVLLGFRCGEVPMRRDEVELLVSRAGRRGSVRHLPVGLVAVGSARVASADLAAVRTEIRKQRGLPIGGGLPLDDRHLGLHTINGSISIAPTDVATRIALLFRRVTSLATASADLRR